MVSDPADYVWSSYHCHALGRKIALCTPHEEYLRLGNTCIDRQSAYRELFRIHVDNELLRDIRSSVNKGLAFGGERFQSEIEQLYGRRVRTGKMGRPVLPTQQDKV
jgi:putative transposase